MDRAIHTKCGILLGKKAKNVKPFQHMDNAGNTSILLPFSPSRIMLLTMPSCIIFPIIIKVMQILYEILPKIVFVQNSVQRNDQSIFHKVIAKAF